MRARLTVYHRLGALSIGGKGLLVLSLYRCGIVVVLCNRRTIFGQNLSLRYDKPYDPLYNNLLCVRARARLCAVRFIGDKTVLLYLRISLLVINE